MHSIVPLTAKEIGDMFREKRDIVWDQLRRQYPCIQFAYPAIVYNKRLKTTAGRAFFDSNPQFIDICNDMVWEHTNQMIEETIPHELAHLAAYTAFGDSGHGKGWREVMAFLNKEANRCHNMINSRHEAAKMARMK